jgi:hypothetical protein
MAKNEQEFNVKLMQAAELYLCLKIINCPPENYNYSRKDITENAWTKVAQEMNGTGKYFIFFVILCFLFVLFYYLLIRQSC